MNDYTDGKTSGLKHSDTGIEQNYKGGDRKRIVKWRRDKKYPNYLTVAFGDCDMNGSTRIGLF